VGRTLELDGVIHEIVGVVDREFVAPELVAGTPDVWTALWLDPDRENSFGSAVIGRLGFGVGEGAAEAEVGELLRRAGDGAPSWPLLGAHVRDLRTAIVGGVGSTLWLFLGAVALLLAMACTNVANLVLARGLDRAGEVSIRRALGASRGRLVRQLLAESMVTALAGGAAGVVLAWMLVSGFVALAPGGIPRLAEVSVDGRVLLFALVVSCTTGILFGMAPALNATRPMSGNRTTATRGAGRLRGALVVIETAIALVLVLASGLLMNSFVRMRTVDPGFEADGLVAMQIELRSGYEDRSSWSPFWNMLLERVEALPGVESAALSAFTPFVGFPMAQAYSPEDAGLDPEESAFLPSVPVSAGWERTLGLELLDGRAFDGSEQSESEPVVMVNRAFADRYWPGETAIAGRRIRSGALAAPGGTWYRVVGVTSDMRHRLGRDPTPTVYHPHAQHLWRTMSVLARVQGDPAPVISGLRNAVGSIDDALPVQRIGAVGTLASESVTEPRFYSTLSAGFGAIALILALVGIHGTSAWTTARRSREIGIRLTLGARPRDVRTMLTLKALWLALAGVTVGIAAALTGAGRLEDYLYDLSPTDPTTLVATVAIIVGTAMTAAWLPARRASRVDPAATLRSDT
jgi:predicted permease